MTVKELKDILDTYPEDQSIFMRVWLEYFGETIRHLDLVATKVQQHASGSVLITGTHELK